MGNEKYAFLAKNTFLLTISTFGSNILSFFLVPLYTNILSTAEMGIADLITTTSSLLLYVVTLGIGDAVFRFSMDSHINSHEILKTGLVYTSKGLFYFSIFLTIFALFNPIKWPQYCYIFLWINLTINALASVFRNYLRAIDRVKDVAIAGIIATVVTIVSNLVLLLWIRAGIIGLLISLNCGLAFSTIYMIVRSDGLSVALKGTICDDRVRRAMLKYCIPLTLNGLAWWINSSLDHYFVTVIAGVEVNGIYSIASKIPTVLSMLTTVFTQAWSISAIKEFDSNDAEGFFAKAYSLYNAFLLIAGSILVLLNIPLAKVLYAKDFFQAWKCSSWLIVSVLFNSLGGFIGSIFGAVKNSRIMATSTIIAALINILLNTILIPMYGAEGASIATLGSFFALWMIRLYFSRRYIKWKIYVVRDTVAYVLLISQVIFEHNDSHSYILQLLCSLFIIVLYSKAVIQIIHKFIEMIRQYKLQMPNN